MELPSVGILQLIDPETGQVLHVDTRQKGLLQRYQDLARQDLTSRNQLFKKYGIDFLQVFTHKPYDVDLVRFFRQRAMRMR
jgi:hypothetical protein